MKRTSSFIKIGCAVLALVLASLPLSSLACAACYGEPDAPMSKGLTWAVFVLGGVVATVLVGVTIFFVHMGRHESPAGPAPEDKKI